MSTSTKTKYAELENYLRNHSDQSHVELTFQEIEEIIGSKLPDSAYKFRPWWSNNPSNSVITNAWLNAGFKSERVSMPEQRLVFRKIEPLAPKPEAEKVPSIPPSRSYDIELRHPLLGALKGTIRITPGTDLTAPADPEWADR
jgi:hypothetical protein